VGKHRGWKLKGGYRQIKEGAECTMRKSGHPNGRHSYSEGKVGANRGKNRADEKISGGEDQSWKETEGGAPCRKQRLEQIVIGGGSVVLGNAGSTPGPWGKRWAKRKKQRAQQG